MVSDKKVTSGLKSARPPLGRPGRRRVAPAGLPVPGAPSSENVVPEAASLCLLSPKIRSRRLASGRSEVDSRTPGEVVSSERSPVLPSRWRGRKNRGVEKEPVGLTTNRVESTRKEEFRS